MVHDDDDESWNLGLLLLLLPILLLIPPPTPQSQPLADPDICLGVMVPDIRLEGVNLIF